MKTNITRDIDRQYGYDLEIETSYTRDDGFMCAALLNGEQIDMFYGATAEADAKARLYSEVTHQINGGAQPVAASAPATYAELVEAREQAYIVARNADQAMDELKASVTLEVAADPDYKNDAMRKARITAMLSECTTPLWQREAADAYRKALAAIEVYQEAAKDARAKMRHETAQMELRAAELHLQAAQAKHDALEPTDESPYGHFGDDKPMSYYNAVAADDDMPF